MAPLPRGSHPGDTFTVSPLPRPATSLGARVYRVSTAGGLLIFSAITLSALQQWAQCHHVHLHMEK